MPKNKNNFRYNAKCYLVEKSRFGYSKHSEKGRMAAEQKADPKPGYVATRTDNIHSIGTLRNYQQVASELHDYLKERGLSKDIRHPDQLTKEILGDYLKYRDKKVDPTSVSRDISALNKLTDYRFGLNRKEFNLRSDSMKDAINNRGEKFHHTKYNPVNYTEGILLIKAFGCRRESVEGGNYQVKEGSLYQKDDKIYARLLEKGGRYREAEALDKYKEQLQQTFKIENGEPMNKEQFKTAYQQDQSNYLVEKLTSKIEAHQFRAEYSQDLYSQLASQKTDLKNDYRGYDRDVLKEVSQNMGHNRINVVVDRYLNK